MEPQKIQQSPKAVTGYELYHSPEFKAMCEKLGFARELFTVDCEITFRICRDTPVELVQKYHARTPRPAPAPRHYTRAFAPGEPLLGIGAPYTSPGGLDGDAGAFLYGFDPGPGGVTLAHYSSDPAKHRRPRETTAPTDEDFRTFKPYTAAGAAVDWEGGTRPGFESIDPKILTRTRFRFAGLDCEEIIIDRGRGFRGVAWCLHPFECIRVGGSDLRPAKHRGWEPGPERENPLVLSEYWCRPGDERETEKALEHARASARRGFAEVHGVPEDEGVGVTQKAVVREEEGGGRDKPVFDVVSTPVTECPGCKAPARKAFAEKREFWAGRGKAHCELCGWETEIHTLEYKTVSEEKPQE